MTASSCGWRDKAGRLGSREDVRPGAGLFFWVSVYPLIQRYLFQSKHSTIPLTAHSVLTMVPYTHVPLSATLVNTSTLWVPMFSPYSIQSRIRQPRDWRDGSRVKSTRCLFRGLGFRISTPSAHNHPQLQFQGIQSPPLTSMNTKYKCGAQTHMHAKY